MWQIHEYLDLIQKFTALTENFRFKRQKKRRKLSPPHKEILKHICKMKAEQLSKDMKEANSHFEKQPQFIRASLYLDEIQSEIRNQQPIQKYFASELLKVQGSMKFKSKEFDSACKNYEEAISMFRYVINHRKNWRNEGIFDEDLEYVDENGKSEKEKKLVKGLKVLLYQNICLVYLKLSQKKIELVEDAIFVTSEALKLDNRASKAYYLRAKSRMCRAIITNDDFKQSIKDYKKSYELSNDKNQSIIEELEKCQSLFSKCKEKEISSGKELPSNSKTVTNNSQKIPQQSYPTAAKTQEYRNQCPKNVDSKQLQSENQNQGEDKQVKKEQKKKQKQNEFRKSNCNYEEEEKKCNEIDKDENENNLEQQIMEENFKENEISQRTEELIKQIYADNDSTDLSFQLSFEIDPNSEIPREIKDLESFINFQSQKILQAYEKTGRFQELDQLKKQLNLAKAAKNQLENVARLDFNRPSQKLIESARINNIDLNDEEIKEQFRTIQKQNILDIRSWLTKNGYMDYSSSINNNNTNSHHTHQQNGFQQPFSPSEQYKQNNLSSSTLNSSSSTLSSNYEEQKQNHLSQQSLKYTSNNQIPSQIQNSYCQEISKTQDDDEIQESNYRFLNEHNNDQLQDQQTQNQSMERELLREIALRLSSCGMQNEEELELLLEKMRNLKFQEDLDFEDEGEDENEYEQEEEGGEGEYNQQYFDQEEYEDQEEESVLNQAISNEEDSQEKQKEQFQWVDIVALTSVVMLAFALIFALFKDNIMSLF